MTSDGVPCPQVLYKMGARKFSVISIPPLGCLPSQRLRRLKQLGTQGCFDPLNDLSLRSYPMVAAMLRDLSRELPGMAYSLADSFGFAALTDPLAAGFVSADSACCGGGRLGAEADCLPAPRSAPTATASSYGTGCTLPSGPPCSARRPTTTARPSSPSPSPLSSWHSRGLLDFRQGAFS